MIMPDRPLKAHVSDSKHPFATLTSTDNSSMSSATEAAEGTIAHAYNTPTSSLSIDTASDPPLAVVLRPSAANVAAACSQPYPLESLTKLGIRVRDFAYESTLPPISSTPQFVGGARALKRERSTYEDDDNPFAPPRSLGESRRERSPEFGAGAKKAKGLARELTEPVDSQLPPSQPTLARHTGFIEIGQSLSALIPDGEQGGSSQLSTPQRHGFSKGPFARSPLGGSSWVSPSQPDQASQESDTWIDTPLVTPNGSLQWKVTNTSAISASQLDTESQVPTAEDVTLSQLGFTPDPSQQYSQNVFHGSPESPMGEPSSRHTEHPASPSPSRPRIPAMSPHQPVESLLTHLPPRYDFRDRDNSSVPSSLPPSDHVIRSRPRDQRSTSLSPRRLSPRPSRPKGKQTSQSARPLRRSARNAQKTNESGAIVS
ncbi:hypothetical protein EIP91_008349 [Steccherinum ochraceum]|uniref:Uncharacterized protein n=1 Tax=Steccherinum ochraceum TaxID=92696 RepID=A0A4R0RNK0_9APHY|nr:hypothetical protein EIP91_008349 [Steccherinum ochraceum]